MLPSCMSPSFDYKSAVGLHVDGYLIVVCRDHTAFLLYGFTILSEADSEMDGVYSVIGVGPRNLLIYDIAAD